MHDPVVANNKNSAGPSRLENFFKSASFSRALPLKPGLQTYKSSDPSTVSVSNSPKPLPNCPAARLLCLTSRLTSPISFGDRPTAYRTRSQKTSPAANNSANEADNP